MCGDGLWETQKEVDRLSAAWGQELRSWSSFNSASNSFTPPVMPITVVDLVKVQ